MEAKVAAKLFGPGSPLEMGTETVKYSTSTTDAPHHKGLEHPIFKKLPQTFHELYALNQQNHGEKVFLVYDNKRLTFNDVHKLSEQLGSAMVYKYGIKKGDRVVICMRNSIEYVLIFMAATRVGAVAIPMNSWWTTSELEYGLKNCESSLVFCDDMIFSRLKGILNKLDFVNKFVLCNSKDKSAIDSKVVLFKTFLESGKNLTKVKFPCEKDDNAVLMYTSGSTGFPKGVVLTHRSVTHTMNSAIANAALMKSIAKMKNNLEGDKDDKDVKLQDSILLTVPLFHVTGLVVVLLLSLFTGRKVVMMFKWDARKALALIEQEKITQFTGVPTMSLELMQHPDFSKFDTSSLKAVSGGGAPPPPQMIKDVGKKFKKASAGQGYGLTETSAFTTINSAENYLLKPTSCGPPVPGCTVEIWDTETNLKLDKPESVGKVMIKGANIMKEYWKNKKATEEAITEDGYFDSGDIGKLDKDGYLYILDRAKQLVIRGGENISTAEVEAAVYNHQGVAECAVIGIDHPTLIEEVGVAVYPKSGQASNITLNTVRDACGNLANFKKPTVLFMYEKQLPRGATGKVLKKAIKVECNTRHKNSSKL